MMSVRVGCPLCGEKADFRHRESYTDLKTSALYTLFACAACTGEFWEPLKNPGGAWYEHDERYADRNQNPILDANWNHRQVISFFSPFTGSVLDVGCGVGNFLAYALSRGWSGNGIDFDRDAIEAGKRTFGLSNLSVSDVHAFAKKNPKQSFDLITFFDVLEHIDDHHAFMTEVKNLLAATGAIALSVPYGPHAKFLMPADVPPRHLTRWNEKSIKRFLDRFGFDVLYTRRTAASIRFIILKLRFKFGSRFSVGLVHKVQKSVSAPQGGKRGIVHAVSLLASAKDGIIFGIPAIFIWLYLLPFRTRYIGLYVIARLRQTSDGQAKKV